MNKYSATETEVLRDIIQNGSWVVSDETPDSVNVEMITSLIDPDDFSPARSQIVERTPGWVDVVGPRFVSGQDGDVLLLESGDELHEPYMFTVTRSGELVALFPTGLIVICPIGKSSQATFGRLA